MSSEGSPRICFSGSEVVSRLRRVVKVDPREYVVHVADVSGGPFIVLVGIILSQNTSDKNSIRALRKFVDEIGVRPDQVVRAGLHRIEEAIRVAGGYRRKARAIMELARLLAEKGERYLLEEDPEELRRVLLSIEGIGPKTVDVFLAFMGRARVFPVDTHARRIAYRWGLIPSAGASYERVSEALARFFAGEDYELTHKLLIAFGRKYCRARSPRCDSCPLRECCPFARGLLPRRGRAGSRGR